MQVCSSHGPASGGGGHSGAGSTRGWRFWQIVADQGQGERPLRAGLQPRQDDQKDEGVDEQADRQYIRTDPDGPLSEALTGCNQE